MIKFTFSSDAEETNREGRLIDDITTSSAWWQLCSSLSEPVELQNITAIPNPFSLETTIELPKELNHATLAIYNSSGVRVKELINVDGRSVVIGRDHLPAGLCYLLISENQKVEGTFKLLVVD